MNLHKNARLTPQGRLLMVRRIEEQGWKVAERHRRLARLSAAHTTGWGGIGRAASGCCATGARRPPDCGVVDEAVAVRSNAEHEQPENGDKTKQPYD
jgi:hypothetical protein